MRSNLIVRSILCVLVAVAIAPRAFSAANSDDKKAISGSDALKPTSDYQAKEDQKRDRDASVTEEMASRAVPIPKQMDLDIAWYSPHIDAAKSGKIVKGWVISDLLLLETDKHVLVAVRKEDGYERWRCELVDEIRYQPSVSTNNVLVNVNNYLVAIEKNV